MEKQSKKQDENLVSMELSAVKIQQINKQPVIETSISISQDKKWLIHKTIITDIKPLSYYEKVLA